MDIIGDMRRSCLVKYLRQILASGSSLVRYVVLQQAQRSVEGNRLTRPLTLLSTPRLPRLPRLFMPIYACRSCQAGKLQPILSAAAQHGILKTARSSSTY